MRVRSMVVMAAATLTLAAGGCGGGDVGQQLVNNEQFRGQVMDAIVQHKTLATQVVDKVFQSDSLRTALVDHMLANEDVAKYVVVRVGTNPAALDLVLGVAARDSALRAHVETLVKGMEMASPAHK